MKNEARMFACTKSPLDNMSILVSNNLRAVSVGANSNSI
jgi:hypothetical protein